MISLNQKILMIYPELLKIDCSPVNNSNPPYLLQDDSDGRGTYIKEWNYEQPQPTQDALGE